MSMVNAPRRPTIEIALASYGTLNLNLRVADGSIRGSGHGSARLWVVAERDPDAELSGASGRLLYAYNHQRSGQVVWVDGGPIHRVTVRTIAKALVLDVETDLPADVEGIVHARITQAPCVCGAGAVGSAGPSGDPHYVAWVRADDLPWIVRA